MADYEDDPAILANLEKARLALIAAGYTVLNDPAISDEKTLYVPLGIANEVYRGVYVTWSGNDFETFDVTLWPVNEKNEFLIDYPESGDSAMTIEGMLNFLKSEKENPADLSDYIGADPI